ncbi:MAG: hypothetical protein ACREMY_23625, partial [bacterium]
MAPRLQLSPLEAVEVKRAILILVTVALAAFGAGSLLTPRPVISSRSGHPVPASPHDFADDERVDAYGNEVTSAVAKYSLDGAGGPY